MAIKKLETKEKLKNLGNCFLVGVGLDAIVEGIVGITNNPEIVQHGIRDITIYQQLVSEKPVLFTILGGVILAQGVYNLAVSYKNK